MNEDRAQELRQILAASGSVTFIKSGQALSLRGDLVKNREYVRELTKLQVRTAYGGSVVWAAREGVVCVVWVRFCVMRWESPHASSMVLC